jgi:glutaredoxin-related protein
VRQGKERMRDGPEGEAALRQPPVLALLANETTPQAQGCYRFEVLDASEDAELRSWLARFAGRETMPCVFVDHRPVGGFGEIKTLEHSGELDRLVRGEV